MTFILVYCLARNYFVRAEGNKRSEDSEGYLMNSSSAERRLDGSFSPILSLDPKVLDKTSRDCYTNGELLFFLKRSASDSYNARLAMASRGTPDEALD